MSYCNHTLPSVKVTPEEMAEICKRFRIAPAHYRCFLTLANQGTAKSKVFRRRLVDCPNYKAATNALLQVLSRFVAHRFPPQR